MSHFSTLVLLPAEAQHESRGVVQERVAALLAPYDENMDVEPYERPCWCVGNEAQRAGREQAEKELGEMSRDVYESLNKEKLERYRKLEFASFDRNLTDEESAERKALDKELEVLWREFCKPWTERREQIAAAHPLYQKPDPKCEECKGTGVDLTTYNPQSKWDWWTIGGRWTGLLAPEYDPAKDERNQEICWLCGGTGDRASFRGEPKSQQHPSGCNGCMGKGKSLKFASDWVDVGNTGMVRDIPESVSAFAVVTPDGQWHEKGSMGWFACVSNEREDWPEQFKAILAAHQDCVAVVTDLHI